MLNLVQLQERLKDVPMQALMQYANGGNPQIPPFLALGELNRRKKMQEAAAAEEAQQSAGAPTVKEQIEQATGLMATQPPQPQEQPQEQPVQMAGGGMARSPDMMKALALMAMKRGLTGLPMRRDMFKRGDYAGGGIVAFSNGGGASTFDEFTSDTPSYEGTREKATKEEISLMSLPQLQEYYRSGYIPEDVKAAAAERKATKPSKKAEDVPVKMRERDDGEAPRPKTTGAGGIPDLIKKVLSLDPEKMSLYKAPTRQTAEEFKTEQERLGELFGVAKDPYAELKKRYSDIEAEDKRVRAEQPMEQLSRFLTGIAQSRRGAGFGEAGASGVAAVAELRAQQQALNRKLDLDMAGLRSVIAEREDARARGNMDKFLALDKEAKEAARAVEKDKINLLQSQAQLLNQTRQVGAQEMQAMAAMMNAGRGEERSQQAAVEKALNRLEQDTEYRIAKIEDKAKAERMRQNAIREALSGYAITGSSSGAKEYRKYDAQGNPVQ